MHRAAVIVCVVVLGIALLAGSFWIVGRIRNTLAPPTPVAVQPGFTILQNQDGTKSGLAKSDAKLYVDDGGTFQEMLPSSTPFDEIIRAIDLPSFATLTTSYLRDKNHVYYAVINKTGIYEIWVVRGADPPSFSVLTDAHGEYSLYARDDKNVYLMTAAIAGAEPTSFSVLSDGFSRDRGHVYWQGAEIKRADPSTFSVLTYDDFLQSGYKFSRDSNHVYFSTVDALPADATWAIEDADPATFRIFGETNTGSIYSADKDHVFESAGIIEGADAATFQIVMSGSQFDAFDAHHKYRWGKAIE
jgi:hypothetical protein